MRQRPTRSQSCRSQPRKQRSRGSRRERDEALQQQTATSEVLASFAGHRQMPSPFSTRSSRVPRVCVTHFSVVYLYDGDHIHIAATNKTTPERRPNSTTSGAKAAGSSTPEAEQYWTAQSYTSPMCLRTQSTRGISASRGWRAVLAVPLLRDGKPVGARTVQKLSQRHFPTDKFNY